MRHGEHGIGYQPHQEVQPGMNARPAAITSAITPLHSAAPTPICKLVKALKATKPYITPQIIGAKPVLDIRRQMPGKQINLWRLAQRGITVSGNKQQTGNGEDQTKQRRGRIIEHRDAPAID